MRTRQVSTAISKDRCRGAEPIANRRRLAIMVTDIVESTPLLVELGDDDWLTVLRWHDHILRAAFAATGGREINHMGDGFCVVFERPLAALECAVLIQQRLAVARRARDIEVHVRIGIQWADVLDTGGTCIGRAVHEASRIAGITSGDEIVASTNAFRAAGGGFSASEPRSVELRGLPDPLEVVSLAPASHPGRNGALTRT
jgi:class 3 adenylate cyclase